MKEEEIRPQAIFEEYLRLAAEDTVTFFSDAELVDGTCPACGVRGDPSITKHGFEYELCPDCQTLYVNPRPVAAAFSKYYTEAPSSKYWATTFYRETASARREKLWKPKANAVAGLLERLARCEKQTVVDIGGGYGLFAEEIRSLLGSDPVVIEPAPHLAAVCREKNLLVVEKFLEDVLTSDLPAGPRAFVSFELFEHLHDPARFLNQLKQLMASGDLFIFTTLSGTGVDIQALWEDSKSVMPPHHLNFFNPRSIRRLLERCGLEPIEVSTPGKLDIDILANNHHLIKDRFWKTMISGSSDAERQQWQHFISASGWSSHMMVVCKKP
jgi:SAM-dependent methyltransferase